MSPLDTIIQAAQLAAFMILGLFVVWLIGTGLTFILETAIGVLL